jgi:hypothetical protein
MIKILLACMILASSAHAQTEPSVKHPSAFVQLKGAPKKVRSTFEQLSNDDAYKAAACRPIANKSGATLGISCDKPDSALMDMLNRHSSSGIQWTLSARGCPTGCTLMSCPPPSGPTSCCKKVSGVYKICN